MFKLSSLAFAAVLIVTAQQANAQLESLFMMQGLGSPVDTSDDADVDVDADAGMVMNLAPQIRAYPLTSQRAENFFTAFTAMEKAVAKYNTPEKQAEAASYGDRYMTQMMAGAAASKAASAAMAFMPPPAAIAMSAVTSVGNMFGMNLSPQSLIMQAAMSGLDSLPNELQEDFGPSLLGGFKSQDEFMAVTMQMASAYSELKYEEMQGRITPQQMEDYTYASAQYKAQISPQQMQANLAVLRPMKDKLYHAFKDDEQVPPEMQ